MGNLWFATNALLRSVRSYKTHKARSGVAAAVLAKLALARVSAWSAVTGSDIDPNAKIGERLSLPHPNGVVVHAEATIGDDCMIMQQVTIGQLADGLAPKIGSRVYIGAGAKILGGIAIGDRASIGANAVVLCDVPADWTAVGVPAKLRPPKAPLAGAVAYEMSRELAP